MGLVVPLLVSPGRKNELSCLHELPGYLGTLGISMIIFYQL